MAVWSPKGRLGFTSVPAQVLGEAGDGVSLGLSQASLSSHLQTKVLSALEQK